METGNAEVQADTRAEVQSETIETNETQEVDVQGLQEKLETLQKSYERVLNESKSHAEKYKSLRDKMTNDEQQRLEQSGDLKQLLELEKRKRQEVEQRLTDTRKTALKKSLNFEIAQFANDAHDITDVISNVTKSDLVNYNEDTLQFEGINEAVTMLRENKPYLFRNQNIPSMVTGRPTINTPKEKSLNDMSVEELTKALANTLR